MTVCPNPRCDHGWVTVQSDYADKHLPTVAADDWHRMTDEARAEYVARMDALRESLNSSVYPCSVCRPAQFHRWLGGHFASGHDTESCDECTTPRHRRGATTAPSTTTS